MNESRFLTREQSAQYLTDRGLPVSRNTLQKWATTGGGPRYRRFGNRAVYTVEDLNEWVEEKLSPPRSSSTAA
ncbi:hypothetical protein TspCOW1_29840 [Thiohalobacter sp. COW1]|uniref:helix-turn-helix transcriptional regulator n=1 Tax=Thiohalobacter sp. COW1 TaxID=2795687 RepID=UPI00191610E4|nr:hypothetical protein TspCOW1_29840 [Thiohalobacter sp. COW1]